ncbi:MAG: FapA family protein [Treponema sp.]|jgi:uncharacterized protein (DUF342 family)|nr:FapA family protein [Treponema sp.]
MAVIAKGSASIVINSDETEAKLVFIPDNEGLGWDPDAIIKLTGEHRLSPAPSPKSLEPFLQKAAKAKTSDPMEMVLYQGVAPEAPEGEKAAWEALPVPDDLAALQQEVLSAASAPDLYRIRVEKIKKESVVKKPNPLPFLPPKEEKVVTWEKKETREKAEVNAEVKEVRYAGKGRKLGTLTPPKPGKPGKNVFNRPVPPKAQGDPAFLLGAGISRVKNDLTALYGGFLRIGAGWADIVPLAKHLWSVDRGSDGVTLFFKFEPGDPRFAPPKGAEVLAAAVDKGAAGANLVPVETVDEAIGEALKTGEAVEAFSLLQVQEASAKVEISPDRMEAVLNLRKGLAGALPLEMKTISRALKDSGVRGFDAEKLKADIKAFMEGTETELLQYPLVQGTASTRGRDRELALAVKFLEEAEAAPILDRLRTAGEGLPLKEVTGAALVEKDDKIARMGPVSAGEPGKDVFGTVLPGLPGNDPELKLFQGLAQHGSDITASQGGLLLVKAAERSFQAAIVEYRDARVLITVSEDAMSARGDLFAGAGAGLPLTGETVMKALSAAGVVKGIDKKALETGVKTANEKGRCSGLILARGEPPLAKNIPHVQWLVPIEWAGLLPAPVPAEPAAGTPQGSANTAASVEAAVAAVAAKAKLTELPVRIQTMQINAGTPIAEIRPGDPEGRAGWDVRGAALGPERGIAVPVSHDDSITETPAGNGVRLGAARSGTLNYDGRDLKISSLKGIKGDVGKATGNITFPGELRIQGNVESGFSVMAGLNVLIGGGVESSLVSAGGKAVIAGGVRGAGKGVVRARATIETAFVEEATLLAVDDIKVAKGCVRCNIKTNGKLLVTAETGKLTGGVCRARHGVEVQELGSEKGHQTEVSFGQDYLVKDQIEMIERELEKVHAALKRIEERITGAAKNPAALNAARAEKVKYLKMQEQLNMKVFTLREKFEVHHESELRVRGTVHPGVVMESHGRYYEVNQTRKGVVFYFDRATGRIMERGL